MTDKKPPVSVDIGISARAELKGEVPSTVLGRLGNQIADIISPWSEKRGLQGDKLRLERFALGLEIARKTRQIIENEKIDIKPIADKFLLPPLEEGSKENEDSDLVRWWAKLLASQLDANNTPRAYFNHLLKNITDSEARILDRIWRSKIASYTGKRELLENYNSGYAKTEIMTIIRSTLNENYSKLSDFSDDIQTKSDVLSQIENKITDTLFLFYELFMPVIRDNVNNSDKNIDDVVIQNRIPFSNDEMNSIEVLINLGVLEKFDFDWNIPMWNISNLSIKVVMISLTNLGLEFLVKCMPSEDSALYAESSD